MRRSLLLMGVAVALAGCGLDPEYRAAREAERAQEAAKQAAADGAYCESLGATRGSDVYVNCRLTRDQLRQQQVAADEARSQAYQQQLQRALNPPRVNCTSTTTFGTTNTTCY